MDSRAALGATKLRGSEDSRSRAETAKLNKRTEFGFLYAANSKLYQEWFYVSSAGDLST
jgi:hypothetical protein